MSAGLHAAVGSGNAETANHGMVPAPEPARRRRTCCRTERHNPLAPGTSSRSCSRLRCARIQALFVHWTKPRRFRLVLDRASMNIPGSSFFAPVVVLVSLWILLGVHERSFKQRLKCALQTTIWNYTIFTASRGARSTAAVVAIFFNQSSKKRLQWPVCGQIFSKEVSSRVRNCLMTRTWT